MTERGQNLTSRTLSGLRWTYLSVVLSAGMQLVQLAVMSRLLAPAAFGLVAAAQLTLRFGSYFARMGVSQALVQRAEISDEDVRAGFSSGVVLGFAFAGAFWLAAPAVAVAVFREPDLVAILRALSVTLLLTGLQMTSQSLLQRSFRFRELAVIELVAYAVGYLVVGLTLAVAGAGVWSLVAATLTQGAIAAGLSYARVRHPLRPLLRWRALRSLYAYGSRISVIGFLEWLGEHLDNLAVGRYEGVGPLGQYSRAYVLVSLPLYRFTTSLNDVLFPGFAELQAEPDRLRRSYLSAVGAAAAVLLPTCAGIAVAAPELVATVLGPQWGATVAVVPWIALATAFHFLSTFPAVICESTARLNRKLAIEVAHIIVLGLLLLALAGRGLWVYALALAIGESIRHLGYIAAMRAPIRLSLTDVARRYLPALLTAGAVAAALAPLRAAAGLPAPLLLAADIAVGGTVLAASLRFGPLRGVRDDVLGRVSPGRGQRLARLLLG